MAIFLIMIYNQEEADTYASISEKKGRHASVLSPLAGGDGLRRAAAEAAPGTVPRVPRFQVPRFRRLVAHFQSFF